jgi:hypothetical protein
LKSGFDCDQLRAAWCGRRDHRRCG